MFDNTCEKRIEECKERLESLCVAKRTVIDEIAAHQTREMDSGNQKWDTE
ncbi:hypothetical protein [Halomontanus rarus]|nr:hypothetical protein [Halovivax sp. TS33]